MTESKEFKHAILVVILVTAVIFTGLIFLGNSSGHHVDAEHFAINQGKMMFNYFAEYRAAAVITFLKDIPLDEDFAEDVKSVIYRRENGKELFDEEYMEKLHQLSETPVAKELSSMMEENYKHALETLKDEDEIHDFKTALYQRLRGTLLDFNKERIRHAEKKH